MWITFGIFKRNVHEERDKQECRKISVDLGSANEKIVS